MMYYLHNGIAFKSALTTPLKLMILVVASALALAGCGGSDLEPSGTANPPTEPPPKQVETSTVATPVIAPNGGEFVDSVEVSISSATPIATIHFTTDGSLPTASSPVYSGPITITQNTEIKAMGVLTGANDSNIASASFTITAAPENNPPVIAPIASQTVTAGEIISFSAQSSDADGTVPTLTAVNLPAAATFTDNGDGSATFEWATTSSDVGTRTITIIATDSADPTVAVSSDVNLTVSADPIVQVIAPTINPNGGEFTNSVEVTLSTVTTGATILFTLDGSDPAANGTTYSGPFSLTATTTVKAVSALNNQTSGQTEATFTAVQVANNPPTISPIANQTVTAGETMGFNVNSSDPDGTIPVLSAIGLPEGATFTDQANGSAAFSWLTDANDVAAGVITITITATDGADPTISTSINVALQVVDAAATLPPSINPNGGTFTGSQSVTLTDNAGGANLIYTVDGSVPSTTNGTTYSGPFNVTETTTVRAIAVVGDNVSSVVQADFTKNVVDTTPPPKEVDLGDVTHYWQFEDASSNSFKNYIDRTTATCTDCPSAQAGPFDNAEKFNGTSNILSAPYDDRLAWSGATNLTVEAWVKLDGTCQTEETVIGRFDQASGIRWSLGCDNSFAAFNMIDSENNSVALTGATNIANNQWHHIAAVRSGNNFLLYVDGKQEKTASASLSGDFIGNAAPLTLGGLNGLNQFFMGSLDEVAIHSAAQSAARIKQHFKDGEIGLHRGLRGCEASVKITPLGDSITVGQVASATNTGQRASYRPFLFNDLQTGGYDIEFIGHYSTTNLGVKNAYGIDYDAGHTARSGITPLVMSDAINNRGFLVQDDQNPPNPLPTVDVVLVHLGTNIRDKAENTPYDLSVAAERQAAITQAIEDLGSLLDGIYRINGEQTVVVMAKIVQNLESADTQAYTTELNAAIAAMANARSGDRLLLVDQAARVNQPALFNADLTHPNDDGSEVMAEVWFNQLSEFMPVCTP